MGILNYMMCIQQNCYMFGMKNGKNYIHFYYDMYYQGTFLHTTYHLSKGILYCKYYNLLHLNMFCKIYHNFSIPSQSQDKFDQGISQHKVCLNNKVSQYRMFDRLQNQCKFYKINGNQYKPYWNLDMFQLGMKPHTVICRNMINQVSMLNSLQNSCRFYKMYHISDKL